MGVGIGHANLRYNKKIFSPDVAGGLESGAVRRRGKRTTPRTRSVYLDEINLILSHLFDMAPVMAHLNVMASEIWEENRIWQGELWR